MSYRIRPHRIRNLSGLKFGRLTVLDNYCHRPVGRHGQQKVHWLCQCQCGRFCWVGRNGLLSKHTKSCGCLHEEQIKRGPVTHGCCRIGSRTPEYQAWAGMIARCSDANNSEYGGRGIIVCDEWRRSFVRFLQDMGKKPTETHSIDRIDNSGPYCPENCRWATLKQQCRNKRSNHYLTHGGRTLMVVEWSELIGLNESTICNRLKRGWSISEALSIPLKGHRCLTKQSH